MVKKFISSAILFFIWLYCSTASADQFRVAAGKVAVNPIIGSYLAGYGKNRKSTGSFDDLFLKVAVIEVGSSDDTLILITLDNIGLTRPDVLAIRAELQKLLPNANVVFSSTHTHAGPDVVGIWGSALWRSGRNEAYISSLIAAAAQLVQELIPQLKAATSRVSSKDVVTDWVNNLSEPDLLDQRLSILQFIDENGASLLTLTNFACHPTVLGPDNTLVSADYLAGFYEHMAGSMNGEHMFLQGSIGGWVQPLQGDRSHDLAVEYGKQLSRQAQKVLAQAEENMFASLNFHEKQISIPLENWGFKLLMWLGVLDRETVDGAMVTSVATFQLGQAQFITHPGETSPAYSLQSRALTDLPHSFVLGLTQDAMGYILKPDYFTNTDAYPNADYLTTVSVGEDAGPRVMGAIKELLSKK